ncbi:unnamed protein product, partial [Closterium sp. NIES-54]
MPQSFEVVNSPPSQSASLGMQPWSHEDVHAVCLEPRTSTLAILLAFTTSHSRWHSLALTGQEDAVLLRHALQCGTK